MFRNLLVALIVATWGCSPGVDGDGQAHEFEEAVPDHTFDADHVLQVDLQMEPADWDALRGQERTFLSVLGGEDCRSQPFANPYTYFHASIVMDGESLPDIGIRKKGFIGSQSTEKPGFRINLDEYVDGAELFGIDNVTLNNSVQDPAFVRQCLTYDLFRAAGQPAPQCNFARVSMNGEDLGIYIHVEPIKRRFLREHFGSDNGDLYEGTVSDFVDGWYKTFEAKTDETDLGFATFAEISSALESEAPGAVLDEYFDVDALLTHLALENITAHWDGYAGNRNNFFVYRDPTTNKFSFVPWGADGTFQADRIDEAPYTKGALVHYLLKDADLAARLEARTNELLDEVWDEGHLVGELDRMVALIDSEMGETPDSERVEDVRRFIEGRRTGLRGTFPAAASPLEGPFCLLERGSLTATFDTTWGTTSSPTDISAQGTLDLSLVWDGAEVPIVRAGVGAGLSEQGEPLLVMVGVIDPMRGALFVPYVQFDPGKISLHEPTTVGLFGGAARGGLLYTDSMTQELVPAGFMESGSVTFDALGTTDGDAVTGSLAATIYAFGEVDP